MILLSLLGLFLFPAPARSHITSLPQSHTISPTSPLCLFTPPLSFEEFFTATLFVSRGTELRAEVTIDGPHILAPESPTAGLDLLSAEPPAPSAAVVREKVDIAALASKADEVYVSAVAERRRREDYDGEDPERYDDYLEGDDGLVHREDWAENEARIGPISWSKTVQAKPPPGRKVPSFYDYHYRVCVRAWYEVTVEVDVRRSSDVLVEDLPHDLGLDVETGHVRSYARSDAIRHRLAEKALEAPKEDYVAEGTGDLRRLHAAVLRLQAKVDYIQGRQVTAERHHVVLREAEGERGSGAMAMQGLWHTVVFVGISAYQIYHIKGWFKNHAPLPY